MEVRPQYKDGQKIPGTVYRVKHLLGAGGMGTVYDVEDTTVGKRYVLKTLHPELCGRDDLAARMTKEARVLARIAHTNIVEVITAGLTNENPRVPFFVMEKLHGQDLRVTLSKHGSLELPHALHIGIDLLDALENAHDRGVIHRDVKPDNIFLHRTQNGATITKLLDFGMMRLLDAGSGMTAGRFVGTLRYASPEQLQGKTVTPATDIYAAGLVIYEMIAGRGPFDEEGNANAIAAARLHREPPLLMHWGVSVPNVLEKLLRSALSRDPEKRPKDAFTFALKLRTLSKALHAAERAAREVLSKSEINTVQNLVDPSKPPSTPPITPSAPVRVGSPSAPTDPDPMVGMVVSPTAASPGAASPPPASPAQVVHATARVVVSPVAPPPAGRGDATEPAQPRAEAPEAKAGATKDTIVGMAPPTMHGATPEDASITDALTRPTLKSAGTVDRSAPTRSVPFGPPPAVGPVGTQPIPVVVASQPWAGDTRSPTTSAATTFGPGADLSPDPAVAAEQLLVALSTHEMQATSSDAGSARTLPPDRRRGLALAVVAVAALVVLVIGTVSLVRRARRGDAEQASPSVSTAVTNASEPTAAPPPPEEMPSAALAAGASAAPLPPTTAAEPASVPTSAPTTTVAATATAPRPKASRPATARETSTTEAAPVAPPAPSPSSPLRRKLPGSGL